MTWNATLPFTALRGERLEMRDYSTSSARIRLLNERPDVCIDAMAEIAQHMNPAQVASLQQMLANLNINQQ